MKTIYIVRHGQDVDNANKILNGRRDEPLTSIGREQVKLTGARLLNKEIDLIYVSPALRARQTAEIIGEMIGLTDMVIEPDLAERDFGILTGKPVADIAKYCHHIFVGDRINYFLDGDGVEQYPELMARAKRVLIKIMSDSQDKNILLVTHGAIGKMIEAAWYDWTWEYALTTPYFDNAESIELKK